MKKYEKIEKAIKLVARKYSSYLIEYDDLVQELWVLALSKKDLENHPEPLIYAVCKNGAIDIYRKQLDLYNSEFASEITSEIGQGVMISKLPGVEESSTIKGLIELFPENSKERHYVVLKLYNNGLLHHSEISEADEVYIKFIDEDLEREYIKELGYTGPNSPGSWTAKKRTMKKVIESYLFSM